MALSQDGSIDMNELMRIWSNERNAPELLMYEGALIESVQEAVEEQEVKMKEMPNTYDNWFIKNLGEIEVQRVKYILRSYFRIRLKKIEQFIQYITTEDKEMAKLSPAERKFAEGYKQLVNTHFINSFTKFLPQKVSSLPGEKDPFTGQMESAPSKPNLDKHVICRVKQNLGEVQIDPQTEASIRLDINDVLLIRYESARLLLHTNQLELL